MISKKLMGNFKKFGILYIFLLLVVLATIISKGIFIMPANLINIVTQTSVIGTIALGQTLVILTAGIDLSVGAVMVLAGIVAAFNQNLGIIPFALIAVTTGLLVGMINGLLVTKFHIQPFIATLAMMSIARGIAATLTRGFFIQLRFKGEELFGRGKIFGYIPNAVILWAIVFCILLFILTRTKWGYYLYTVGGNQKVAYLSGVNINKVRLLAYTLSGFTCGVAALIDTSRVGLANPFIGYSYNLDSIAAVVVGGTSLSGGYGTLGGTVLGAIILGVLSNLMNILNVSQYFQMTVKGLIVITFVVIHEILNRLSENSLFKN